MIHFWRGENGHWECAYDPEDKEVARLEALVEGMDANDILGCYIDSAQIIARKAGLMQTAWDRGHGVQEDGLGTVFPYGSFAVPVPETADDAVEVRKMRDSVILKERKRFRRRVP